MTYDSSCSIRLLHDILSMNILTRPDKIALICDNQRLTYRQIEEMSNRLANAFINSGIKNNERVLLYLLNSVDLAISIFAALKAGAVFSVIDYANNPETLSYIAADCAAAAIVTYDKQIETVEKLFGELTSLKLAVVTGNCSASGTGRILCMSEIMRSFSDDSPAAQRISCDLAYLLYTSGSTGSAKGVLTTHRSSLFTIESGIERFGITENDIHAIPLPLSFAPGMNQFFQTMRAGGTVLLERSFAFPTVTLKKMAAEGATGLAAVPTILTLLLQMDLSRYDLSKLRYIISSGAALATGVIENLRKKFPDKQLFSMYGMAEASFILCLDPGQIDIRPSSVGKPFPGTDAYIVDENGRKVNYGELGELVARGGHVRSGYWNDPQATAQRFRPGPLPGEFVCYSGDVFYQDNDGFFYFVARNDEIIKSGAKKVVPREIENALYKFNGVIEAAAIGIPDPVLGHALKAFVVLGPQADKNISADDILEYCRTVLEAYKVPKQLIICESLPKTAGGKIKKTELK